MHFLGFAGISVLMGIFILIISDPDSLKQQLKIIWFSLVTIGIIEEYRQFLDPGRSAEFLDALANMVGVSVEIGITLGLSYLVANKQRVFSSVLQLYPMFLMMLLLGLLYINERPFVKMEVSFQERIRSLAALIGF